MKSLVIDKKFWNGKRVLITGHSGFKGSWLSLWLRELGAEVIGVSKNPIYNPNIYTIIGLNNLITDINVDIRDSEGIKKIFNTYKPEIVFHLAAQPLVRYSYKNPVETIDVNINGTAVILYEASLCDSTKVVVNVTTDKCYENKEWVWAYREGDPLGSNDPYSASKAASEIITESFYKAFYKNSGKALATVRAGNVIGGGDWSEDRLVPDIIRAVYEGKSLNIRNGNAIRPWQHVLEPLSGYILLAEKLWQYPLEYSEPWNFGPTTEDVLSVSEVSKNLLSLCYDGDSNSLINIGESDEQLHEAQILKLDSTKAIERLGWKRKLNSLEALKETALWYKAFYNNEDMYRYSLNFIDIFMNDKL